MLVIIVILTFIFIAAIITGVVLYTGDESETLDEPVAEGEVGTARPGTSTTHISGAGGLDSLPPGTTPSETLAGSGDTLCSSTLCTGDKVLRSTTKKGTTEDVCCRDKSCQIDWNPDYGGDPEQCKNDGMVFDEEYTNGTDGKTNAECCKEDTTSYSKWCVQKAAYKPDGTKVLTKSPSPWRGGRIGAVTDIDAFYLMSQAGTTTWHSVSTGDVGVEECKVKCDEEPECHGFWFEKNNGGCNLRKKLGDGHTDEDYDLSVGFEINSDQDNHLHAGEMYIKSTMLSHAKRKQTIDGEIKLAGVDKEFCPFKFVSIYGNNSWHSNAHIGMTVTMPGETKRTTCEGPAGTLLNGVKLMTDVNSRVPQVTACSQACEADATCGGFWAYNGGTGGGRCCLKNYAVTMDTITTDNMKNSHLKAAHNGATFIKVDDGKMRPRPWSKSNGSPKQS
jgi:hypothetical protein|tara:strand:- start:176 stop:1516 length:1341 start_codon:yes stop_codon:yes gene_type:complete